MARIFVTRKIPDAGLALLRDAGHDIEVSSKDGVLTKEELITELQGSEYDGVLSLLTDTIDGEVMDAAKSVKIFANYAVGYNNIDTEAADERGLLVTNTPGVLTDTVAEYTVALILALLKRIPEADRYTRAGKYEGWAPELLLGSDLKGKTLGIVGAGRIGCGVAIRLQRAFGMNVFYSDMSPSTELEDSIPCQFKTTDEVLQESDVVSIHVPLLESTHNLINTEKLSLMKPTASLVNTSRGPVVDEAALVEALKNGTIRSAGLDVFENEPSLEPGLVELENVIITPHIASASEETRDKMSILAAENLIDYFAGKTPRNLVKG